MAEFKRIDKYQSDNIYFIFSFHGPTAPSEPWFHDHTQAHHIR